MEFLQPFFEQIIIAIASVVAGFICFYLKKLAAKVGVDIDQEMEYKIRSEARRGILYAAEYGAKYFKLYDKMLSGDAKLRLAIEHLLEKHPNISREEAKRLIESQLSRVGEGAVESLRAINEAAES